MSDLMTRFFGPLDKQACFYFYFLTIFFFALMVFIFVSDLYLIATQFNKLNLRHFFNSFMMIINLFIIYFVNRLLYTMCSKSLA